MTSINQTEAVRRVIARERANGKALANHPSTVPRAVVDGILDRIEQAANGALDESSFLALFELAPLGSMPLTIVSDDITSRGVAVFPEELSPEVGAIFSLSSVEGYDQNGGTRWKIELIPDNGMSVARVRGDSFWGKIRERIGRIILKWWGRRRAEESTKGEHRELCPHGEKCEECDFCFMESDFQYDSAREQRFGR